VTPDPSVVVVVVTLQVARPCCRHARSVWRLQRRRFPPCATHASIVAPHDCRHSLRREIADASSPDRPDAELRARLRTVPVMALRAVAQ